MEETKKPQVIAIGYDVATDWHAMNVAGQRLLRCAIYFEEADSRDYCQTLADLWEPFLMRSGLSAGITPLVYRKDPSVLAWVWRQYYVGTQLRMGSMSSDDIRALAEHTAVSALGLYNKFSFTELDSTDIAGGHRKVRLHLYKNGEFVVRE